MKNSKIVYILIALMSFQLSIAQSATQQIDMIPSLWNVNDKTTFEQFDNRETLVLTGGRITVKNEKFSNGTIEVDVYANSKRSFAGITFRKQNDIIEEVYMRMHKSRQVDAIQYTPIFNNESNWQLYREYQAQVTFKNTGWNALRIEVNNNLADVFVNEEKVLSIDDLRTDNTLGEVGLFALFGNRFSNFRITHKNPTQNDNNKNTAIVGDQIITEWNISKARPYKEENLNYEDILNEEYRTVTTEKSGLLPISKYVRKNVSGNFSQNKEDYIIASTAIKVNKKETRIFSFDYSDKIIVFLNGNILFKGNNAFRAKGVQYTGHVDINANTLFLPLKKGTNILHCVVIEKANGWGLMGKIK